MPRHVCTGAKLKCSFAMPPGITNYNVIPDNSKMIDNMHAANILDNVPMAEIPPFGMCMAPTNPQFIAATAAALGTPTPVPCVPIFPAPWVPGAIAPPVMLVNQPALDDTSVLLCMWLGVVSVAYAGQIRKQIS